MGYPLDSILLPMGAKEVKDEKKMEDLWYDCNYVAEEKYDGSRYLSVGGRFFSRRISVKDGFPVEKTDNVPHLTEILKHFPNLILDGEVYYEGMSSNDVTSIMGALPDKAIERQKERGFLKYVLFDILRDLDGNWLIDLTLSERRARLLKVYAAICMKLGITELPDIELSRVESQSKREFYNEIVARGGEGVILKNVNGKYVPDKRPAWNWVKVKKHITDDVVIMGFKPPVREYEGKELETWQYWEQSDKDFDGEIVKWTSNASMSLKTNYEGDRMIIPVAVTQMYGLDVDGIVRVSRVLGDKPHENFEPITKFYFYNWIGAVTFGKWQHVYIDMDGNKWTEDGIKTLHARAVEQAYNVTYDEFKATFGQEVELVELGYCSGLTDETRKDMSENPDKYIGECMEISAMEKTKDGFYRHPQFSRMRPDKNPSECVIGAD